MRYEDFGLGEAVGFEGERSLVLECWVLQGRMHIRTKTILTHLSITATVILTFTL